MAEETWKILIEDSTTTSGAGGAAGGGVSTGEDEAVVQSRTKQFHEQSMQMLGWFKPFVITGGIFYMLYQHSQIVSTVMGTIGKILGAIMDVILLPFMPLFVAVVNAIVPLIPIIQRLSEAFFGPIVRFLTGKLTQFTDWLSNEVNWDSIEEWLANAGETVVGWIETAYNWLANVLLPWWKDHAWPWLVTQWQHFYTWITNIKWDEVVAGIREICIWVARIAGYLLGKNTVGNVLGPIAGALTAAVAFFATGGPLSPAAYVAAGATYMAVSGLVKETAGVATGYIAGEGVQEAWPSQQTGGYIYKGGMYRLHSGERVINEDDAKYGGSGIQMVNTFNIELALTGTVDDLAREVEEKITQRLTSIMRRG